MIWEMKLSTTYFFYLIESLQHTNQSKGLLKELDEPFSIKYTMGNKKKNNPTPPVQSSYGYHSITDLS